MRNSRRSNAARSMRLCAIILTVLVGTAHAAPFAYITNQASNNVSVIDIASNTVIATVAVGTAPYGVAVNPAGTRAYVANQTSNNVSVIDIATNTVVATVAGGTQPTGVAVNPAGTRVYVTNNGSNNVSVIDTATNAVVATVAVGVTPQGVTVNPAGTRAYVADEGSNSVSVIDTATNAVVTSVAVGTLPQGVAVNSAGTRVYVTNVGTNNVSVIDTATNAVVTTVAVGVRPQGIAFDPAGARAYVANDGSNNVSVIDAATNAVVATVAVGTSPQGVAVNPAGTRVYVANLTSNNVSVIDTAFNTVVSTVAVGTDPSAFGLFIAPATIPNLVAVLSRKTHGMVGPFDLPINTQQTSAGPVTVESRAIGSGHTLVFQFTGPITSIGGATAVEALNVPVGMASPMISGNNVVITLTGIPDNKRVKIELNGINGSGSASVALGFLVGDVNNTGLVSSSDISGVKARVGEVADGTNFRRDVNASGGITSLDVSAVKARSGLALPVTWASLAVGSNHTCGLKNSGAVYCWGFNNQGQLGDDTFSQRTLPVAVSGAITFATLTAGAIHSCGLTRDGVAYCWGDNTYGQLGIGSTVSLSQSPAAVVGGLTFASLTAGGYYTCGLTGGGVAYCWGANFSGELGDGTETRRNAPVPVLGVLGFASLTTSLLKHTCGLNRGGSALCWGWNGYGQLGVNDGMPHPAPVAVRGGILFAGLAAGAQHTCGHSSGGAAYCWGDFSFGQLGNGVNSNTQNPPDSTVPLAVLGGNTFASLSAGNGHTCGLTASGAAFCWGYNTDGRLGDGSTTDRSTPVAVSGALVFGRIWAGGGHTCGLTGTAEAYCWGFNAQGQLGDGSIVNRTAPVVVANP